MLSSGTGGRQKLLGCAVSSDGQEVVVCGVKTLYFLTAKGRVFGKSSAYIGPIGRLQVFLCAEYFGKYVIVGTAGGQLYQFEGKQLRRVIQAHAVRNDMGYNTKFLK